MANVQGSGDLSVFTIDATSMLALIKNVSYQAQIDKGEVGSIKRPGIRRQSVKKGITITTAMMSAMSGDAGLMASNLAISAFSVGGVSYAGYLRGGSFRGSFTTREVSAVGDAYKWPQHFGKDYTAEVTLVITLTGDPNPMRNLSAGVHDADVLDQDLINVVFTITIDALTVTVPMQISSMKIDFNERQEMVCTLSLEGNDPGGSSDFPTAPTGTTTLLEKAFNLYNTALAFVLTTASGANGVAYAGNMIITDFGFNFNDAEITMIDYTFMSRGNFTATNGS